MKPILYQLQFFLLSQQVKNVGNPFMCTSKVAIRGNDYWGEGGLKDC